MSRARGDIAEDWQSYGKRVTQSQIDKLSAAERDSRREVEQANRKRSALIPEEEVHQPIPPTSQPLTSQSSRLQASPLHAPGRGDALTETSPVAPAHSMPRSSPQHGSEPVSESNRKVPPLQTSAQGLDDPPISLIPQQDADLIPPPRAASDHARTDHLPPASSKRATHLPQGINRPPPTNPHPDGQTKPKTQPLRPPVAALPLRRIDLGNVPVADAFADEGDIVSWHE